MVTAASTPDWIEALSTLGIGLLGLTFGAFQFWAEGFRPHVKALLAVGGDSVRVTIANRGRAEGTIHGFDIVDPEGMRIPLHGAGGTFGPFELAARSGKELTFNAPEGRNFTPQDTIVVYWGNHEKREHPQPTQVSFYDTNTGPGARTQ